MLGLWVLCQVGQVQAEENWTQTVSGPITVKTRPTVHGSNIKEVWSEGDVGVSALDIQGDAHRPNPIPALHAVCQRGPGWAPQAEADGAHLVYTRLELPLVTPRDYVERVHNDHLVAADGGGTFEQRWEAVPDRLPKRVNVIRVRVNEGQWLVTPKGDRTSHIVYKFTVDPGGMIPPFAANIGNTSGVTDTFRAVEKEARRRAVEREKVGRSASIRPVKP